MSAVRVPVVGIIGGIGSGKTAIAHAVGEFLRACVIDADEIGHQVLLLDSVKDKLVQTFGTGILDESGDIVRSHLAAQVFGNTEQHRLARMQLEEIVHPEIRNFAQNHLDILQDQENCDVILLDAALLLEAGWSSLCDAVVYLEVPEPIRRGRVQERGWTDQQFRDREASQLSLELKRQQADMTLRNTGDLRAGASDLANWIQSHFSILPQPRKIEIISSVPPSK